MYADRVEGASKRSVKERLNGNSSDNSIRWSQITGKRQRLDDKWEHDFYQDDLPQVSNRKVHARDLRLKLQRKSLQQVSQSGRGTLSGLRDLCEKLSGTMNIQPINADPPKLKVEVVKPARKSVADETPEPEPKRLQLQQQGRRRLGKRLIHQWRASSCLWVLKNTQLLFKQRKLICCSCTHDCCGSESFRHTNGPKKKDNSRVGI